MKRNIFLILILSLLLPAGVSARGKKSTSTVAAEKAAPEKTAAEETSPEALPHSELFRYYGANEAYKVMRKDSKIYSNARETQEERKVAKELILAQRGDTLLAGEGTAEFIESRRAKGLSYIPVVYRGIKGYTSVDNVRPLFLADTDTVYLIQSKSLGKLAAMERSLLPYQFKAINIPVDPMIWMWIALGGLALYLIIFIGGNMWPSIFKNSSVFVFIGSAITSCAEVLYLLSMGDQALWFFSPHAVGWGLAILNFLLMAAVIAAQYWVFADTWLILVPQKDFDGDAVPHWVGMLYIMPGLMAIITVIMLIIDAFTGNTWGIGVYACVYGIMLLAGLAAMGYLIFIKRPLLGIWAFLYYIVASVGLSVCLSILGLWLVVLAIALIIIVIAGGSALAIGKGVVNGAGQTVTGYTSDGRKVTGVKDINGNVKGYDGKTYKID